MVDIIDNLTTEAYRLKSLYEDGQLSTDEYNELLDDLLDLKKVDEQRFEAKVYCEIVETIQVLLALKAIAQI